MRNFAFMETLFEKLALLQWRTVSHIIIIIWEVLTKCVYDMMWAFVWECVHVCEREFGCLRCSSQSISVDTWPNSWTHLSSHTHTHGLHFHKCLSLSIRSSLPIPSPRCTLIVHLCASVLVFVYRCTCCLAIKAADLKPRLGYVTWSGTRMCVCLCVFARQEMWTMWALTVL